MYKILIIGVCVLCLAGCGKFQRELSGWTGQPTETCVDGVSYLQFTSGAAFKVDRTGKPVACNE